jgi:hypothetical protein
METQIVELLLSHKAQRELLETLKAGNSNFYQRAFDIVVRARCATEQRNAETEGSRAQLLRIALELLRTYPRAGRLEILAMMISKYEDLRPVQFPQLVYKRPNGDKWNFWNGFWASCQNPEGANGAA